MFLLTILACGAESAKEPTNLLYVSYALVSGETTQVYNHESDADWGEPGSTSIEVFPLH